MLWHPPQPLDAGELEADVRIEAAGYGSVDDRLLLLLQQLDHLLLGAHVAPDLSVRVVDEANDRCLFREGRKEGLKPIEIIRVEAQAALNNASRYSLDACPVGR